MLKRAVFVILGYGVLSAPLTAQIYQWTDQDGKKHYSDRPHVEATTLEVRPGYTYHTVRHVYDGDTIQLDSGPKVRLLGINTPEVERRDKQGQSGGEEAKRWLTRKLSGKSIRLETDVEKKDKYGRQLAHVFTREGEHLNIQLVANGLASVNIHPPNLKYTEKLVQAQNIAERKDLGLWRDTHYRARHFREIDNTSGWQRVIGTVSHIKQSRRYLYLQFAPDFSVRIDRRWQKLYPDLKRYRNKAVEARGWIRKSGKKLSLQVRHPADLKIIH